MISKRFVVIALILSFFSTCGQLCAIISFLAIDKRSDNSKMFIRIGERHNPHCLKSDPGACQEIRDRDAILNLVKGIAAAKRKVCVLIEISPFRMDDRLAWKKERFNQGYEPSLLDMLVELSEAHHKVYGSVSFNYFDKLRGLAMVDLFSSWQPLTVTKYFIPYFISPLINTVKGQTGISPQYAALIDKLKKEPTRQNLDAAFKAASHPIKKNYSGIELWRQICQENGAVSYSVHDFYKELENVKCAIRQTLSRLNPSSGQYYILSSYLSRIDVASHKAQVFYQKYVPVSAIGTKGSCLTGLYDALKKTSFSYMFDQYREWAEPLMLDVADVSLFIEAIAAFEKYDVVVSISGAAHSYASQTVCDCLYLQSIINIEGSTKDLVTGDFFSIFSDAKLSEYIGTMKKYIVA